MDWSEYFINIAEQIKFKSKDPSTKIGSVIADDDNTIISTGYNSFPRGLNDSVVERGERPEKYNWMVHAELNSILNAARTGVSVKGSTMYITSGLPCTECAKAIINAGIKKVYCKTVCTTQNKEKWEESQKRALIMLEECNVKVILY